MGEVKEVIEPMALDHEIALNLTGPLPSAAEVVEACRTRAGVEIAWRTHGGPRTATDAMPTRYDGWLVQRADRIAETQGGLLFMLSLEPGQEAPTWIRLTWLAAPHDPELWAALLVTFDALGVLRARTGNLDVDAAGFHAFAERKRAEARASTVQGPKP